MKDWIIPVVLVATVALTALYVAGSVWVLGSCEATSDTRLGTRLVTAGKVLVPVTAIETRYVCPNGIDVWL